MFQILHILQKDFRRHWLEILVALLLLGAYARLNVNPWEPHSRSIFLGRFTSVVETLTPILIVFWAFLTLRIVQGEPLVGDRSWWLTKPYVWWKLLLSKVLFVVVVICIPLLFIQIYFLYAAHFPVIIHMGSVLNMQLGLLFSLFLGVFILASLTKGLGQAVVVIASIAGIAIASSWLAFDSGVSEMSVPSSPGSSHVDFSQLFFIALFLLVLLWQFARRRTWLARFAVAAIIAVTALLAAYVPNNGSIEAAFPLRESASAPVDLSLGKLDTRSNAGWLPFREKITSLVIPVRVSDIPEGTVVQLNGIKLTLTSDNGLTWTGGWQSSYQEFWPGQNSTNLGYSMKRKDFERWKKFVVRLRIEAAFTPYEEANARNIVLTNAFISDRELGTCRIQRLEASSNIECRSPIRSPDIVATIDPRQSTCSDGGPEYSWVGGSEPGFLDPGISPIVDYNLFFRANDTVVDAKPSKGTNTDSSLLCPGTQVRIASPVQKQRFRLKLEVSDVPVDSLAWLAQEPFQISRFSTLSNKSPF